MDPVFLSPALPSELLQFVINRCTYPTTLVICGDRAEFLSSLTHDLIHQQQRRQQQDSPHTILDGEPATLAQPATADPSHPDHPGVDFRLRRRDNGNHNDSTEEAHPHSNRNEPPPPPPVSPTKPHSLLTSPLSQLAVTRHIRTVFIPTVTHLRAFLAVFSVFVPSSGTSSRPGPQAPSPPPSILGATAPLPSSARGGGSGTSGKPNTTAPMLVVYGFLALHRNTSEWSVQGLGTSAAALMEAGQRARVRVVVVEPKLQQQQTHEDGLEEQGVLGERVPVSSGGGRRVGGGGSELEGKTVDVGRVLGRWFRFWEGDW